MSQSPKYTLKADLRGSDFIVIDFDTYKAMLGESRFNLELTYLNLIAYVKTVEDTPCNIFAVRSPSGGLHI